MVAVRDGADGGRSGSNGHSSTPADDADVDAGGGYKSSGAGAMPGSDGRGGSATPKGGIARPLRFDDTRSTPTHTHAGTPSGGGSSLAAIARANNAAAGAPGGRGTPGGRAGSTALPMVNVPGSPTSASVRAGAGGPPGGAAGDEPVPAALASLLHQADKSGKQQKAMPLPVVGAVTRSGAQPTPATSPTAVRRGNSSRSVPASRGAAAMPSSPAGRYARSGGQSTGGSSRNVNAYQTYPAAPAPVRRGGSGSAAGRVPHPGFASRMMQMLCCFSNNAVAVDAQAVPGAPPAAGRSNGRPGAVSTTGETSAAVAAAGANGKRRRRELPPPPTTRINNVRRPASTWGEGPLLAPQLDCDYSRHCLVLDLDETLVHSSFKWVPNADYILPVEIEGTVHNVYVIKRPGCDEFLRRTGELYEVVVFTASLAKYADPLLDMLDTHNVIRARLFREACVYHESAFVKDLSLLGRDPNSTIIIDNSPASYLFQPENALPCDSFIDDMNDRELYQLLDFLENIARVADVREALFQWVNHTWVGPHGVQMMPDSDEEEAAEEEPAEVVPPASGESPQEHLAMADASPGTASVTGIVTGFAPDQTRSHRGATGSSTLALAADVGGEVDAGALMPQQAVSSAMQSSPGIYTPPMHSATHEDVNVALKASPATTSVYNTIASSGGEGAGAMPMAPTHVHRSGSPNRGADSDAIRAAYAAGRADDSSDGTSSHSTHGSTMAQVGAADTPPTPAPATPSPGQGDRVLATHAGNTVGAPTFNISVQVSVTAGNNSAPGSPSVSTLGTSGIMAGVSSSSPAITNSNGSSVIVTPTGGTVTNSSKRFSSPLAAGSVPAQVISITTALAPGSTAYSPDDYMAQQRLELDEDGIGRRTSGRSAAASVRAKRDGENILFVEEDEPTAPEGALQARPRPKSGTQPAAVPA